MSDLISLAIRVKKALSAFICFNNNDITGMFFGYRRKVSKGRGNDENDHALVMDINEDGI